MQVDELGEPQPQQGLGQGEELKQDDVGLLGGDGLAAAAAAANASTNAMAYSGPILLSRAPDTLSYIHTCTGYLDVAHDDIFASSGTLIPIRTPTLILLLPYLNLLYFCPYRNPTILYFT